MSAGGKRWPSSAPFGRSPKVAIAGCIAAASVPSLVLLFWLMSYLDFTPQTPCQIGAVTDVEYQNLFERAKAQQWTVWPGVSDGILLPSRVAKSEPGSQPLTSVLRDKLVESIRELAPNEQDADMQLAAAHAVMRAMRAEYVRRYEVSPGYENGQLRGRGISFMYFIPQIRFAPLCATCLFFWETTIIASFSYDSKLEKYKFHTIYPSFANILYHPNRSDSRNVPAGSCPSFKLISNPSDKFQKEY